MLNLLLLLLLLGNLFVKFFLVLFKGDLVLLLDDLSCNLAQHCLVAFYLCWRILIMSTYDLLSLAIDTELLDRVLSSCLSLHAPEKSPRC